MRRFFAGMVFVFVSSAAYSQTPANSIASGNWNDVNTWDCGCVPDLNNGAIAIKNGYTVTVTADVTIDETTIETGGAIIVNPAVNLILNEDFSATSILTIESAASLTNNGTFDLNGLIFTPCTVIGNITNSGSILIPPTNPEFLLFQSGSSYNHKFTTGGNIPVALWDPGSVCEINDLSAL